MRILFMPQAGALGLGAYTRCLGVAHEAELRGHEVAFFCRKEMVERLQRRSLRVFEAPFPPPPDQTAAQEFGLANSIRIRKMDDQVYLHKTIEAERAVYDSWRPDIIFTENQFSAAISAQLSGLPLLSTAAWVNHPDFESPLYKEEDRVAGVEDAFNNILRAYALPSIKDVFELIHGRSALNIAPTLPELEPQLKGFPNLHFVGSLLDPGMELGAIPEMLLDVPPDLLIYVYLSVGLLSPKQYVPALMSSFSKTKFTVAVAIREGTYRGRKLPQQFGNIFLFNYLPGLRIIRRSAVVLARGGQNTLMACLLAGTPVIGFAGRSSEADFNIRQLTKLGAALHGEVMDFHSGHLRTLVEAAIGNSQLQKQQIMLGNKARQRGGSHTVLQLIEGLLSHR